MKEGISFWDAYTLLTPQPIKSEIPLSFETIDVDYGYVLYTKDILENGTLSIPVLHDRAYIYINKQIIGIVTRNSEKTIQVHSGHLELLIENMGHINFGGEMMEFKGIPKGVYLNDQYLKDWIIYGVAWINNFNLGRYWTIGPQLTLYVPHPILKEGKNELIIFETEHTGDSMTFQDFPLIDIIV
ncbi:hypothetical protein WA158_007041 [Blastocystis sp. Blastoise]